MNKNTEYRSAIAVIGVGNIGAAMAISSCGIANVLRYVRAAMEAGVELGLNPALAAELAASRRLQENSNKRFLV